jgi:hypothetical protein
MFGRNDAKRAVADGVTHTRAFEPVGPFGKNPQHKFSKPPNRFRYFVKVCHAGSHPTVMQQCYFGQKGLAER